MSRMPEQGYPLSALFILIAACAIPMAMSAAAARAIEAGDAGLGEAVGAGLAGCVSLMLLGAIIGLHHYRRGMGAILGGMVGALVGSATGPMMLAPREDFLNLLLLAAGGSAAMVALAAWMRAAADRGKTPQVPEWLTEENPFGAGPDAKTGR